MGKAMARRWMLLLGSPLCAATPFAAASEVTGRFEGNGKAAKLAYAVVLAQGPPQGEKSYQVVMTEHKPSDPAKAALMCHSRKLGSCLSVEVTKSGTLAGGVGGHHPGMKQFGPCGFVKIEELKDEETVLSGRVLTDPRFKEQAKSLFGETCDVDLQFAAPITGAKN